MNLTQAESRASGGERALPARSIAWATVFVLLLMAMFSYLDRQIISLMVDPIRQDLEISDFQIGILQGVAFGLFYAVFGLPMGWLVDRYQRRWVVYWGVTSWSLATAACGLSSNYWQLLIARFGVGIGEATLSPAAYSMIADIFPRHRLAFAMSVFGIGTALGGALALAVGGVIIDWLDSAPPFVLPLIGEMQSWQMIFLIVGLPGLAAAFLILLIPEPKRGHAPPAKTDIDNRALFVFLRRHWLYFTCHFVGFGMIAILAFGWAAWAPASAMRRFGMDAAEIGPLFAVVLIAANLPGFLCSGWICDRWFAKGRTDAHLRYYVYTLGFAVAVAAIGFQFAQSVGPFLLAYAIGAFFLPFTGPAGGHLQIVTPPHFRGRVSALFGLAFNLIGMCLGPPAVGFLTDFVFNDPNRVNSSLALVSIGAGTIGTLCFVIGLAPARRAVAEADRWA